MSDSQVLNIDLNKEINPNFAAVWYSDKPYNILRGGRNSFKSSTVSLKLIHDMLTYTTQNKQVNIPIIRKVSSTIRDSVFLQMQWALNIFNVLPDFEVRVTPPRIIHKKTGSTFYFYGQDDFEKLKSSAIGNVIAVWYEEASEFKNEEEFDQTNITFMRQCHPDQRYVKFYWSYNPPRNPYSWINKWSDRCMDLPDYLVHTSTYKDDRLGFVNDQMKADIQRIKANDYEYYRYLYLGEPVGLGTNVYNFKLFNVIDDLPEGERIIYLLYGLDTGHQQSASACICAGITSKRNVIVLDSWYYSPLNKERKLAPDEQAALIHNFVRSTQKKYNKTILAMTIDSAEGALRNQYYKDFNERWNPVGKLKKVDMIDYVVTLLAQGRVYVLSSTANTKFLEQHRDYRWDEKTVYTDDPKVIKEDDHFPDAFQYLVLDNLRELNLKW